MSIRSLASAARITAAVLAAATAFTVGGCAKSQHSAGSPTTTTNSVVSQPKMRSCDSVDLSYEPKLADQHVRCTLSINNLTLEVSGDPAWSFSLRDQGGVIQQFQEPTSEIGQTGVAPLLQDIDSSGLPVLLVVTDRGGSGGEPMAVWRLTGSPPRFVRAGELFGFRQFYRTTEGLFGNYAHSSAVSGSVTLYRWVDDKLVTVAVLDTQAAEAAVGDEARSWVRNGNVLCALSTDDYLPGASAQRTAALKAAGIDPATAQERFCNQGWVASIYR